MKFCVEFLEFLEMFCLSDKGIKYTDSSNEVPRHWAVSCNGLKRHAGIKRTCIIFHFGPFSHPLTALSLTLVYNYYIWIYLGGLIQVRYHQRLSSNSDNFLVKENPKYKSIITCTYNMTCLGYSSDGVKLRL